MVSVRLVTFKMVTAHVSKATVDAATSIQDWTVQSDQKPSVLWLEPEYISSKLSERDAETMLSGKVVRNGYLTGELVFAYLTHDMLEYVISTFFASSVESKDQTFLYASDENEAQYITCHMTRPRQKTGTMTPTFGGWSNVILRYTNGTDIT